MPQQELPGGDYSPALGPSLLRIILIILGIAILIGLIVLAWRRFM